jgi:hypothetical protein
MASALRLAVSSRAALKTTSTRSFSAGTILRNEATPNLGSVPAQKKPIGGFRGGYVNMHLRETAEFLTVEISLRIAGFLLGFSVASSFAAYHLLEEYQQASAALQSSIEALQVSTEKVSCFPLVVFMKRTCS